MVADMDAMLMIFLAPSDHDLGGRLAREEGSPQGEAQRELPVLQGKRLRGGRAT